MPNNLDFTAMTTASAILKDCATRGFRKHQEIENLATKGIGVVLEQGIYAGLLFFYSQRGKFKAAEVFIPHLLAVARQVEPQEQAPGWQPPLPNLEYLALNVCSKLHTTILVKNLWEQTLTYVRYGAKSLKQSEKKDTAQHREENVAS
jgi:hypothetical protein